MNNKVLLKPCPFCGGKAELVYGYCDYDVWQVACQTDGCHGMAGWADTRDEAAEAWNRRQNNAPDVETAPQWIPVTERLPENAAHPGAFCPKYMVMTKYGVTEGWYNPDKESWFILFWFMTERLLEHEISFGSGDIPRVVKVPLHIGIVTAWMPMPEPCTPAEEGCK